MSKPILEIELKFQLTDQRKKNIPALFDSGSFYTIIRSDCLPSIKAMSPYKSPKVLGTARKGTKIKIVGETALIITIGKKMINSHALVSPNLSREMIIGAETMQSWDINIKNRYGKTQVLIGHDMRDPDIVEVA